MAALNKSFTAKKTCEKFTTHRPLSHMYATASFTNVDHSTDVRNMSILQEIEYVAMLYYLKSIKRVIGVLIEANVIIY